MRAVEAELKDLGHGRGVIERLAEDRTAWRNFVAAQNADRRKASKQVLITSNLHPTVDRQASLSV